MMRRVVIALLAFGMSFVAACGSDDAPVTASTPTDPSSAPAPTVAPDAVEEATISVAAETSTVASTPATLPSGREALSVVDGQAHVLWFWGAH